MFLSFIHFVCLHEDKVNIFETKYTLKIQNLTKKFRKQSKCVDFSFVSFALDTFHMLLKALLLVFNKLAKFNVIKN